MDAFLQNHVEWKQAIERIYGTDRGDEIYGDAFVVFTVCLFKSERLVDNLADYVSKEIRDYESKVDYPFGNMYSLFFNMGLIWHKLGTMYDDNAVEEFKKAVYYLLALSNNISYQQDCYAFRPCSKYLYHSLVKEQLNLSSPTQFNDPFDCPILELLNNHGDDISKLMHRAYRYTTKVACFVKNEKLPTHEDFTNKSKHEGDEPEYLNELMWAHYADSHKGICIQYKIKPVNLIDEKNKLIRLFEVNYDKPFPLDGNIPFLDALCVKGDFWRYEKEVRLIMYSRNQLNDYYSQDGYEINTVYGLLKVIKDYVDWENAENLDALCATRFKAIIDIILAK